MMNTTKMDTVSEEQEIYKENILDHYRNPHNKGILSHPTVQHREFNPLCGDDVTIYLQIDRGIIQEISFMGGGCAISQASISMITDVVQGRSVHEAKNMTPEKVLSFLGVPISNTRIKCALLSLKAIHQALKDYHE